MHNNDSPTNEEILWLSETLRSVGAHVRGAFAGADNQSYTLKGQQDYLTQTDIESERLVRTAVQSVFPDDAILGEEMGGEQDLVHRLWVVDPIDGTANFARGIPHFCISLALLKNGLPFLGGIYDPIHDELFWAGQHLGAYCNDKRMRVSLIKNLADSSIEVGWSNRCSTTHYTQLHNRFLESGASVRRAGSGALGLAYVAAGRIEAYVEVHINAWDVAAGLLLVTEAGGTVNDFWSFDALKKGNRVMACNAALAHDVEMLSACVNPV